MSTDVNMEYQEVKFGEIAKHISKRVEPSETTLGIYVGLEHLDPDSLKIVRHGVPSDVAGQKLLVKKGQIIFGKRRAYQRKVAVADWDCICSAHAMVLEAIPQKILPELLPFFMQSDCFMERAVVISEGSLSPTIKWKILADQKFYLASIEKQHSIKKLLNKLEDSIDLATQSLEKAISVKEIFSAKSFKNNEGIKPIGKFIDLLTGNPFSSKDFKENGDYKLLRGINVTQGYIRWPEGEVKFWNEEEKLKKFEVLENDVLISMDGSLVGKNYALITKENFEKMYLVQRVARLRCNPELNYKYLYHAIGSQVFKNYVDTVKTVTAIPHISPADIRNFEIAVPSMSKQNDISNKLDVYQRAINILQQKIVVLKSMKNKVIEQNLIGLNNV